ncbi:MAG TPA: penicillin-binding transpeptidase domain-containing protein [Trebonia sp.]|nr:penicillin-binding transpeptidase domain-containing protein [Trebonia sp.]
MNRALKRISIAVLVMFLALLINANYLQGFQPASLATRPDNVRGLEAQYQYQRGDIVTSDGVVVATTKPSDDIYKFERVYNNPMVYAPVTGYDTIYSATGVEQAENGLLAGTSSSLSFRNFIDEITGKPRKGATVTLTINSKDQTAAYQGLSSVLANTKNTGGVVAINPKTGAILADASWPSYDTNSLATHDGKQLNAADETLLNTTPSPLVNNATDSLYPPGSTFKIVTTSAWFTQSPAHTPETALSSPQPLKLPNGNFLNNDNDEPCGNNTGQTPAITAFAQSCNTPFAELGIQLGGPTLKSMADNYGYNQNLGITGVNMAESNFTAESDPSFTAYDAIGQHDTVASPLQEAMMAATVANNGTLMKPYLVQQVTASDLSILSSTAPSVLSQPITPAVASEETQMMLQVVASGTAQSPVDNAGAQGLDIAGKTGTAQNGVDSANASDSVFVAFAPANNPKIAVGVIVQGGGYGAVTAAPIAIAVIKAALG